MHVDTFGAIKTLDMSMTGSSRATAAAACRHCRDTGSQIRLILGGRSFWSERVVCRKSSCNQHVVILATNSSSM